ncbi:MAG: ABC transporter ATP-binding protein [Deltaproteobacteria bacterium RIFOXYD12_FULL_57_12]|nr:MAG: ABC transporter ATP-binding protein [Deltaproteobacteria bacterium RIFOXYD12_FULL_57_12]
MRHDYGYFEEEHLAAVGDIGLWQRIAGYVRPYWRGVALAILLSLVITAASLMIPYLVGVGVDRYIVNQDLQLEDRLAGLARIAWPFAGLICLGFLANLLQVILLEWCGQNIMHQLRQGLFSHLLDLHLAFFHKNPVGKLVTRVTNDIQNMYEMFTSVIVTLFNDLISLVGILVVLYWMNWRLALLITLLIPVIVVSTTWFSRMIRDAFRAIRTSLAWLNGFIQEAISGIAIIQLFLREKDTAEKFVALNRGYYLASLRQIRIFGIFMPLLEVLSTVALAMIIWYGGGEIIRGRMSLGELVAFLSYIRLFFQPLREFSQKYSIVQSAMASAERIFQLLDTRTVLPVAAVPLRPASSVGAFEFRQVTFGYDPDSPVLRDFTLKVRAGETLAIVGATGSGKTTVINLLERFYDPGQGVISVDGVDLRQLDPAWLRQQIGLVMQDVYIAPDTMRENILLGLEMSEEDLGRIIEQAQLSDFVRQLPDGLATMLGEGGQDLSAGQRQLVALARVLARDPQILILDEATSNVDSETEARIERALEATLARRTSVVIAHRLSTIRRADRILVMARGRIVEEGTHATLMAGRGIYWHLQELQNNGLHSSRAPESASPAAA